MIHYEIILLSWLNPCKESEKTEDFNIINLVKKKKSEIKPTKKDIDK